MARPEQQAAVQRTHELGVQAGEVAGTLAPSQ